MRVCVCVYVDGCVWVCVCIRACVCVCERVFTAGTPIIFVSLQCQWFENSLSWIVPFYWLTKKPNSSQLSNCWVTRDCWNHSSRLELRSLSNTFMVRRHTEYYHGSLCIEPISSAISRNGPEEVKWLACSVKQLRTGESPTKPPLKGSIGLKISKHLVLWHPEKGSKIALFRLWRTVLGILSWPLNSLSFPLSLSSLSKLSLSPLSHPSLSLLSFSFPYKY